ncbi:MAG: hypothetical protein WBM04_19230, partial [Candidatus Korobacteraceae bacterium]
MRTVPDFYHADLLINNGRSRQVAAPGGRHRPRKIVLSACLMTLLLFVGCEKQEEKPKPGPPEVLVAEVAQQNVPIVNEWVAQLNGPVNAEITPKVQGYLLKQEYQNGYFVKKGQLL